MNDVPDASEQRPRGYKLLLARRSQRGPARGRQVRAGWVMSIGHRRDEVAMVNRSEGRRVIERGDVRVAITEGRVRLARLTGAERLAEPPPAAAPRPVPARRFELEAGG